MKYLLSTVAVLFSFSSLAGEPVINQKGKPMVPPLGVCAAVTSAMVSAQGACLIASNSCQQADLENRGWRRVGQTCPNDKPEFCASPADHAKAKAVAKTTIKAAVAHQAALEGVLCNKPQDFCDNVQILQMAGNELADKCVFKAAVDELTIWPVRNLGFSAKNIIALQKGVCADGAITSEQERKEATAAAAQISQDFTLESLPGTRGRPTMPVCAPIQ